MFCVSMKPQTLTLLNKHIQRISENRLSREILLPKTERRKFVKTA